MADREWMDRAACRLPAGTPPDQIRALADSFFPDVPDRYSEPRAICVGTPAIGLWGGSPPCPVRAECLEYALATDARGGMWGGKTPRARKDQHQARSPRKVGNGRGPAALPPAREGVA